MSWIVNSAICTILLTCLLILKHASCGEIKISTQQGAPVRIFKSEPFFTLDVHFNIDDPLFNVNTENGTEFHVVITMNETHPVLSIMSAELCSISTQPACFSVSDNATLAGNKITVAYYYTQSKRYLHLKLKPKVDLMPWEVYQFKAAPEVHFSNGTSFGFLEDTVISRSAEFVHHHEDTLATQALQHGQRFRFNLTVGPMPDVGEGALNLSRTSIKFNFTGVRYVTGDPVYVYVDGQARITINAPNFTAGIDVPDLNTPDRAVISVPLVAIDNLEYNSLARISYMVYFVESLSETFRNLRFNHTIPTETIEFNALSVSYVVPDPFELYTPIIFTIPLVIPAGGAVRIGFNINGNSTLPFSEIHYSHQSSSNDLSFSGGRRKRSTSLSRSYGYFTVPAGATPANVAVLVTLMPDTGTTTATTLSPVLIIGSTTYNLASFTVPAVPQPKLIITKSVRLIPNTADPQRVRFSVNVTHAPTSTAPARKLNLTEQLYGFDLDDASFSGNYDTWLGRYTRDGLLWTGFYRAELKTTETLRLTYEASLNDKDYDSLPRGTSNFTSLLGYKESTASGAPTVFTMTGVCMSRKDEILEETGSFAFQGVYRPYVDHGFTVLMFIVGLAIGVVMAIIIVCCVLRSKCRSSISPDGDLKDVDEDVLDNVILNQYDVAKRSDIKEGRHKVDRSLVSVLALDQKMKQFRKLDTMDIEDTEEVDDEIENEGTDHRIRSSTLLVNSLAKNGDIDEQTRQRTTGLFKKELHDNDQRLEHHYKKELDTILNSLVAKNKRQFGELVGVQQQERKKIKSSVRNRPKHEKDEIKKLLDEKHKMEQQELAHKLTLEQDEQIEGIRKDFAIRRRLGIKDLQNRYLRNVVREGRLEDEQAEWLLKQHHDQQHKLEDLHDQEIMNQRMLLEEKLARRKQLAQKVDAQEDDGNEMLGSIERQDMALLEKARKSGILDKDEVKVMAKDLVDKMTAVKTRYDKIRMDQEKELNQRLTARKRQLLENKRRQQEQDLSSFEKQRAADQARGQGVLDPMDIVDARHQLLSAQRAELIEIENLEDEEHADELIKLRGGIIVSMQRELAVISDDLTAKLEQEGMDRSAIDKVIKQHERELEKLMEAQEKDKNEQQEAFKRGLAKNRKRWADRREQEKYEQAQLREHEEAVVRNIMTNQVAMSDEERDRIMREYEQQMVKMENSLTLNKLRQRRKLEERVSQQKRDQLAKLETKQNLEKRKMKRRHKEDIDDMDKTEVEGEQLALMRKHVNQKLNVLHGDKIQLTDELVEIETEMAEERAMDIKKQEEDLAALMAAHQMEKAKEVAKINENQRAIETLKTNLLDGLNANAVISDPECEQILARHQKEKERLNKRQDSDRSKQEKLIHQRLAERRKQMESQLAKKHEKEMEEALGSAKSKASAKFARALLINKQMVEREQFKNRLEKEIDQAIEDLRQQQTLRKQEALQKLEMKFISGLIRLGKVPEADLVQLLRSLCPLKNEKEIADMYQEIVDQAKDDRMGDNKLNTEMKMRMRHSALL